MTGLSQDERLECAGIWRESAAAQRRDVVVMMGRATLVISDMAGEVLSHWSLAAIERISSGRGPALYSPGADSAEELELDDSAMIEALGTVRRAAARTRPRPGRLRRSMFAIILAGLLALGLLWLPDALVQHTAAIIPPATRSEIGERLLRALEPVAGRPCAGREGQQALDALTERLFPGGPWQVVVLPGGPARTAHLPGQILLIHRALIEAQATPEIAAGALLAEALRATEHDPLVDLMQEAGPLATLWLLTGGTIGRDVLDRHAGTLLVMPPEAVRPGPLLARFVAARVSSTPYARHADPEGLRLTALVARDRFPDGTPEPLLTDAAWLRLQTICGA